MITLRARATDPGLVVSWPRFKSGELAPRSRWKCLMTTLLTDVVTDVIEFARELDAKCIVTPLFPNGFTTASFDVAIRGTGFQINCGRRLVRGLFPLNPIAAEFGGNYDVLLTVTADTPEVERRLADLVRQRYACEVAIDSRQSPSASDETSHDAQP